MRGKIALWLDLKWGQGHKSASLTQELVPLLGGHICLPKSSLVYLPCCPPASGVQDAGLSRRQSSWARTFVLAVNGDKVS